MCRIFVVSNMRRVFVLFNDESQVVAGYLPHSRPRVDTTHDFKPGLLVDRVLRMRKVRDLGPKPLQQVQETSLGAS